MHSISKLGRILGVTMVSSVLVLAHEVRSITEETSEARTTSLKLARWCPIGGIDNTIRSFQRGIAANS